MPLAGTFDVLDFGEVLDLLSRRNATGRLTSRTMNMHGTIWLTGGQATAADVASQTGGDSKAKWQTQLEEFCFDALRSLKGSFEFHPEDDDVTVRAGTPVPLDNVIEAGRRRLEQWHEVEATIHSFEAVPRMAEAIDDSVEVDQGAWRILVALDGRHNVASLAKRLGQDLLGFCLQLKPLIESGAVILEQPDGWLKSLPKVRLEVANRDGEVFIDSALDSSLDNGGTGSSSAEGGDGLSFAVVPRSAAEAAAPDGQAAASEPDGQGEAEPDGSGEAGESGAGGSGAAGSDPAGSDAPPSGDGESDPEVPGAGAATSGADGSEAAESGPDASGSGSGDGESSADGSAAAESDPDTSGDGESDTVAKPTEADSDLPPPETSRRWRLLGRSKPSGQLAG